VRDGFFIALYGAGYRMREHWVSILNWALRILVGGVFIASGILKLYPIEPFELTLIDLGIFSWSYSPFISRLIISAEIFLGILIVGNINYNSFALKAAILLLIIFSVFIVYLVLVGGSEADCGCMGGYVRLSPGESLLKNGFLLVALIFLRDRGLKLRLSWKWMLPLLLITCAAPFILNPVQIGSQHHHLTNEEPYKINVSSLPQPTDSDKLVDLTSGEKILAFFLVECPHCKYAAHKLSIAHKQYDIPEVFFVFKSDKLAVEEFLKDSKSDFPYIIFKDQQIFKMTSGIFPTVLYLNDGLVYHQWTGETLSNLEMEKFSDLRGHYLR